MLIEAVSENIFTVVSDIECIEEIDASIISGRTNCYCPSLCRENAYISSISTSTWPGEKFFSQVQQLYSSRGSGLKEAVKNIFTIR